MTMNQIFRRLPSNLSRREDLLVGAYNALVQARHRVGESEVRDGVAEVLGHLGMTESQMGALALVWYPENRRDYLRGQEAVLRHLGLSLG